MREIQSLLRPLAAMAVSALLAGCAGGGSVPPQPLVDQIGAALCKSDHGVSISPCSVSLSWKLPKETITAKGPKGGVFSFNDKTCSAEKIATVTGSGTKFTVVWGSASGSCSVVFTDKSGGKTIGTATLKVQNTA